MSSGESIGPAEDLAEALACRLTELGFPAARSYMPVLEDIGLDNVSIWVIPASHETAVQSRAANRHQVVAAVVIAKKVKKTSDVTEVDALARTVEQIKALWNDSAEGGVLRREKLAGMSWQGTLQNDPLYDADHFYHGKRFIAQVNVTYSGTR